MPEKISDYEEADFLEEIRRVAEVVDGTPRTVDINEYADFHSSTLLRRFESYEVAVIKAGLEPNHKSRVEVECDNCGEQFSRIPSQLKGQENMFCSRDCHSEYLNETGKRRGENHPCWDGGDVTVECSHCGANLERTSHRVERCDEFFCDDDCKGNWQSDNLSGEANPNYMKVEVPCSNCGEQLKKAPFFLRKHDHPFCDKECHDEWQRDFAPTGEDHPNFERIETQCKTCDNTLRLKPHEYNEDGHNFCTIDCYIEWVQNCPREDHPHAVEWHDLECSNCGCHLERKPSEAKLHDDFFCSIECERDWKREHWVGKNSPGWGGGYRDYYGPNWRKQRKKARERDNLTCQGCGLSQDDHLDEWGERLHVHHIQPFRTFDDYEDANNLDNLVTLCRSCHHGKWEGIPLRPQLAAAD